MLINFINQVLCHLNVWFNLQSRIFSDKTSAAKVKTVAPANATKMQTLKLQLIANGTLQATSNDVVNVPTNRISKRKVSRHS
jgi:hypothetical protein